MTTMTTRTAFPGASARSEPVVLADERDGSLERLIHLEELERRLIARDIHDDTIAAMTAVTFECARLRELLTDDSEIEIADRISRTVEAAADRLRSLVFELEPHILHEEGLGAAIRVLLDDLQSVTDIDYRLDDRTGQEARGVVSAATRTMAFRVTREALANVRMHSRARMVHVGISAPFRGVDVRIGDDGVGFDVAASVASHIGHLGLSSMQERVEEAGGTFRVDSCPGLGTTVSFWLPSTIAGIDGDLVAGRWPG
jgi:signal transduction histidine kinase